MNLLFVYGSLKRGFSNHFYLANAEWVGNAQTKPGYRMFDYGGYPAAIVDSGGYSIKGELWRVSDDCLTLIDELEGIDEGLYKRATASLEPPFADQEGVIMYHYLLETRELPDVGGEWPRARDIAKQG
tara:strand:+ start:60636 stop:61019 length:384 start_codon:yes stop_codon:yes gene_type:complete